ncbi:helix-turn-helix transcriptional regulator [Candidatus Thiothrix sp. Deng01]|uniref:Helix-turn-helix domain-containing protein n=2 Tax=Thiothrix TaxID=1030 RepID=A0A7L6AW10_9GAMM|nr:helix-turn-helix transcriptional regulator [Candidatus Thiothrix sp. Deng01]MEB4591845.1 helix-turn-helix transcriptional regulator [Candidatus Thiothrix sp. Deng01]QLQ33233.1 MAG: helix-turn-helix domain-containing protein [Candidatus Thiothrix singaporensis]
MSAKDLADYLRHRVGSLGFSKSEAARRADISRQTWYRLLNAEISDAKLSTLIRLAEALETTPLHILQIYFGEEVFNNSSAQADDNRRAQA